jgi:hypothetical protein
MYLTTKEVARLVDFVGDYVNHEDVQEEIKRLVKLLVATGHPLRFVFDEELIKLSLFSFGSFKSSCLI